MYFFKSGLQGIWDLSFEGSEGDLLYTRIPSVNVHVYCQCCKDSFTQLDFSSCLNTPNVVLEKYIFSPQMVVRHAT